MYLLTQNVNLIKNSNIAQLRPQLKPAKNKINYIFGTSGQKLKIQKAKLVRIKFPIELSNFYLAKNVFWTKLFLPVKLNKAPAKLNPSGFGSAQLISSLF